MYKSQKFKVGRMRHRLTIQEPVTVTDSGGGETVTWQDIAVNPDVFVEILSIKEEDNIKFTQISHKITHRLVMRYRNDLKLSNRLTDGINNFDIEKIEDKDGTKKFMICYAVKV